MKVQIKDTHDKTIFEGRYSYLEGGRTNNFPSFSISLRNDKEDFELDFFCESKEEMEHLIQNLKDIGNDIE